MDDQRETVLREGRTTLPLQYWLWVPAVGVVAFVVGVVVWRQAAPALAVAAAGALCALAVLARMASWRWRITSTYLEVGRLSWPAFRGGRSLHLSRIGRIEVRTGGRDQVWDAVSFGRRDGRLFPWMRGAIVAEQGLGIGLAGPDALSPVQAAGQRVVIGTAEVGDAHDVARVLREAVAVLRQKYPIPPEHHVRVVPPPGSRRSPETTDAPSAGPAPEAAAEPAANAREPAGPEPKAAPASSGLETGLETGLEIGRAAVEPEADAAAAAAASEPALGEPAVGEPAASEPAVGDAAGAGPAAAGASASEAAGAASSVPAKRTSARNRASRGRTGSGTNNGSGGGAGSRAGFKKATQPQTSRRAKPPRGS